MLTTTHHKENPMDLTRRTVLLAGLAAASVGGGTSATEGTVAAHSRELPLLPLDGELRFDKASRIAAADDFGHIVHRTPKGVLLPRSDQDVAKQSAGLVGWAARSRRRAKTTRYMAARRSVPAL
jgi:hypothetical protein